MQNNKTLRFILWHLHCFSSFASLLLVSQIVTPVKLPLSRDTGDAGLTVGSCQNAGATNRKYFQYLFNLQTCFYFAYNEYCSTVEIRRVFVQEYKCLYNLNFTSSNVNKIELPSKEL